MAAVGAGEGEVGGGVECVEDFAAAAGDEFTVDEMMDCGFSELLTDAVQGFRRDGRDGWMGCHALHIVTRSSESGV